MCDDTTEQGCVEDDYSSAALFFIEDKSAFIEDQGYPEIAVQYLYKMIRSLERVELKFSEEKKLKFSPLFMDYYDAFIDANAEKFTVKVQTRSSKKSIKTLYVYQLCEDAITINAIEKTSITEKYKGPLDSFLNLYGPASGMEYEWVFSKLIEFNAPYCNRKSISKDGLEDWATLYDLAKDISSEDESWDQDLILTLRETLRLLNRKPFTDVKRSFNK